MLPDLSGPNANTFEAGATLRCCPDDYWREVKLDYPGYFAEQIATFQRLCNLDESSDK